MKHRACIIVFRCSDRDMGQFLSFSCFNKTFLFFFLKNRINKVRSVRAESLLTAATKNTMKIHTVCKYCIQYAYIDYMDIVVLTDFVLFIILLYISAKMGKDKAKTQCFSLQFRNVYTLNFISTDSHFC